MDRDTRLDFKHELQDLEPLVDDRIEKWVEQAGIEEELPKRRFEAKVEAMESLLPEVYDQVTS